MKKQKQSAPDIEIKILLEKSCADDPLVRCEAIQALSNFQSLEVIRVLMDALQDDHPFVRWEAARSLGRVGARLQRRGAGLSLNRLLRSSARVTTVLELLESRMDTEDATHRSAVADALGELGLAAGADALLRLLKDESPEVRESAAIALGKLGMEKVVPALVDALRDTSLSVRCAAADAIGCIGGPRAIVALLLWLNDENRMFRARVVAALGHIGGRSSAVNRALIEVLDDQRPDVRWQAVRALGRAGNSTAIPHLKRLFEDRTVVFGVPMCDLAREAVRRINWRHRGLWSQLRRLIYSVWVAIVEKKR